jgi:hypothetical protein
MNVWLVTPAWSRPEVTRLALAQRAHLQGELAARGVTLSCVVVADDDNLEVAAEFGFDGLWQDNEFLGRKLNDGIEYAWVRDADWICFCGSDNWLHPDLFEGLDSVVNDDDVVVAGRSLAVVDLASGRAVVSRPGGSKGVAPWLAPQLLFDRFGPRPVREDATSGMEMQLAIGLGLPRFVFHDPNPCARVDFKSEVGMTSFAAFDRPGLPEARLRDFYPSELCDLVDAAPVGVAA